MNIKSLLLGSAAALLAVSGARAADAVVVVEVSPDYAQALSRWPDYPFRVIEPALDPFGIAVLSRHPLANAQVLHDTRGLASIDVAIDTPQGCVALRARCCSRLRWVYSGCVARYRCQ